MIDPITQYFTQAAAQLEQVLRECGADIRRAGEAVAESIANDRDFLTFGSGHSELIAREAFWRAGGLAPANLIYDHTGGDLERLEGVAAAILGHYTLRPGSTLVVVSNSGINAVPVEAAMIARESGLTVVAITSIQHSRSVPPRHSSGKKLYDVAHIIIDTHIERGDVSIQLPDSDIKTGALSTVVGAAIMQGIVVQAASVLLERGIEPPVLVSANLPEGDAHNLALKEKYMPRLARLPIDTADLIKR
ncbi:MAG: SIS domain-containing protein [Anaerolineae bacterium]|nr:SIS domain-containing protein [Anaerolineae bacterium]